jgi:hypothetical protein
MLKTVLILLACLVLALLIGVPYLQAYQRRKALERRRRDQPSSSKDNQSSNGSPPTDP